MRNDPHFIRRVDSQASALRAAAVAWAKNAARDPDDNDPEDKKSLVLWSLLGQAAVEYASTIPLARTRRK